MWTTSSRSGLTRHYALAAAPLTAVCALALTGCSIESTPVRGTPSAAPSSPDASYHGTSTAPATSASSPTRTASPSASPTRTVSIRATPSHSSSSTAGVSGSQQFPRLAPIAPDGTVKADNLSIKLTKIEHVAGEPTGIGEIKGPALRLTISIANDGATTLNLGRVVVNAYYGKGLSPAGTFQHPGGKPFEGDLRSGGTATSVVLFAVPEDEQGDVTVTVSYKTGRPAATFKGSFR